jgi:mannose-6-phosphate isomerase-like protein (cupin superfamily)
MADRKPIGAETDYLVVDQSRLTEPELEGRELGGANVSLIFIDARPTEGPRLHRHPYGEIFVVLEGRSTFTVGTRTLVVSAGKTVLVQAGVAHKFVNNGTERLRQVDIHLNPKTRGPLRAPRASKGTRTE